MFLNFGIIVEDNFQEITEIDDCIKEYPPLFISVYDWWAYDVNPK